MKPDLKPIAGCVLPGGLGLWAAVPPRPREESLMSASLLFPYQRLLVLGCLGCHDMTPQTGWIQQQTLVSHTCGHGVVQEQGAR